jgi:hypothetical protein
MPGFAISAPKVIRVSRRGLWLLLGDEELHLPYEHFPWFKLATIKQLTTVEWPTEDHLYGPMLGIDLSIQSIRDLEAFPLLSKPGG